MLSFGGQTIIPKLKPSGHFFGGQIPCLGSKPPGYFWEKLVFPPSFPTVFFCWPSTDFGRVVMVIVLDLQKVVESFKGLEIQLVMVQLLTLTTVHRYDL